METGKWKLENRNSKFENPARAGRRSPREKSALSRGERVTRDGAVISRRGPGEGLLQPRTKPEMDNREPV
jgi:hypothetical protein